jgi:hypothetical protein
VTPTETTIYAVTAGPLACVNCPNLRASLVNTSKVLSATALSVKRAALPMVQIDWLEGRIFADRALVSANVGANVDSSQVWIRVPDLAGPCPPAPATAIAPCSSGLTQVFTRDANRCIVGAGCLKAGPCPLYLQACSSGYRQVGWPAAPNACSAYACDPEFVAP